MIKWVQEPVLAAHHYDAGDIAPLRTTHCYMQPILQCQYHHDIALRFPTWHKRCFMLVTYAYQPMRKKLATVTAHLELTVSSPWTKWSQPAVTGPWLSCDLAVIILKMPWLSCDLAVTELWPLLAVTEPWSLGLEPWPPCSPWAHRDNFVLMGDYRMSCNS